MVELDPRLWPDVASTAPATIMVHGTPLTLPVQGTPMHVPGPWKGGRKAITQRKAETADEFAVRCQEQIDAELVRAEPPMPPTHALPATHAARACLQARQGAAASMADSHTGHTTPEGRRPPRLPWGEICMFRVGDFSPCPLAWGISTLSVKLRGLGDVRVRWFSYHPPCLTDLE